MRWAVAARGGRSVGAAGFVLRGMGVVATIIGAYRCSGNASVSKTENEGSIPSAGAKAFNRVDVGGTLASPLSL